MSSSRLTSQRSADPVRYKQALLIAEALLEEVSLAHFAFCHPDDPVAETALAYADCNTKDVVGPGSATRPYFHVNDYVNAYGVPKSFTAGDTLGLITNANGVQLYGATYKAFVTINANASLGPAAAPIAGTGGDDTNVLHISVRVLYGEGQSLVLDRYRTRYAPNSLP